MKLVQRTPFASLAIVRLGRAEWRVSDAAGDGQLLGYIERLRADRFELVWMSDPIRWGYTDTFDAALSAFADGDRFVGEIFPTRAPLEGRGTRRRVARVALSGDLARHRNTWVGRVDRSGVA